MAPEVGAVAGSRAAARRRTITKRSKQGSTRRHAEAWDGTSAAMGACVATGPVPPTPFTGAVLAGVARGAPLVSGPPPLPSSPLRAWMPVLAPTSGPRYHHRRCREGSVRSLVDDFVACRSINDPTSTWVLVNKRNGLSPRGFEPADLRVPRWSTPAATAAGRRGERPAAMAAASVRAGAGPMGIDTAYRSLATQERSTRSSSPAAGGSGPTPGICAPGSASTRPA